MTTKTRSARGVMVDFDLIKIKSQLADNPKPVDVKKREDFIDRKLRRRVKRITKKTEPVVVLEDAIDDAVEAVIDDVVEAAIDDVVVVDIIDVDVADIDDVPGAKKKRIIKKNK